MSNSGEFGRRGLLYVVLAKIAVVLGKTAGDLLTTVGLQEELGFNRSERVGIGS